ncbi:MAG: hypothetical protein LBS91_09030 [Clostridiales Family XIII bacterium]|jgi:hypothetical protein|nr:hypothetical protein [Clostridiales Family XIII bacterium]
MDTAKNNPIEDELNAIRVKLYEQTKDMTTPEQTAFFHKMAQDGLARHGIKAKYADPVSARR